MERTNLTLEEDLLESVKSAFAVSTYSEAVNLAMREALRAIKVKNLSSFAGSKLWEGDLREMRDDLRYGKR